MTTRKPRILYFLRQYPLLCETYIQTEIDHLRADHDVHVITRQAPEDPGDYNEDPAPFTHVRDLDHAVEVAKEFQPDVIHAHWMLVAPGTFHVAKATDTPFTIRAHSFDTIPTRARYLQEWMQMAPKVLPVVARDELCLGVLAFPFSRAWLEQMGVPSEKIHDCRPVVDIARFRDRGPNGDAVMNTGACLPKKAVPDYIELAARMPDKRFDYYPVSYQTEQMEALNAERGSPVHFHRTVKHREMPAIYKAHGWLVYTADKALHNVGWPIAVAEAQASGCGVLLANVRPDLAEYVGEGGFLYDDASEVERIVREPVPEDVREAGFEEAEKSDIARHLPLLTDLWRPFLR